MILTFCVDGKVYYDDSGKYYARSFNGLFSKYKYIADDICFLVRTEPLNKEVDFTPLQKEINIVPLPNFKSPQKYLRLIGEVKEIIENQVIKSDVLIIRLPGSVSQIAIKYAKKYKKPYLIECVGCPFDAYRNHSLLGKLIAPYEYIKNKTSIRDAKFALYVTNGFLQRRYPCSGLTVGISDVEINRINDDILTRRLDKIKTESPKCILSTAGTVEVRYKGQQYVIEALYQLKKMGFSNYEYYIIGGGDNTRLQNEVKKYDLEEEVVFVGNIKHEMIFDLLDKTDIYVQPSTVEGLPRSVVEAMSRACPVIASRVGGIPELINDSYLFDVGNVEQITELLLKIKKEEMCEMAKENFVKAREFEPETLMNKRLAFYDKFIESIKGEE